MSEDQFHFALQLFADDDKKPDDSKSDDSKKPDDKKSDDDNRKSYDETYVKGLRDEAKRHRLEREETARERDDLAKKVADREKKDLEEDGKLKELLEKERDERKKLEDGYKGKLSASDRRYILAEARALAIKEGIIDPSDVKAAIDVSDLRIDDDDEVPGLADKVAKLKESKPHWFKSDAKPDDKSDKKKPPVTTPAPKKDGDNATKDFMKVDDKEFAAKLADMGVTSF
jgi:hypothetical protein